MGRRVELAANVQFVADLQDRLAALPGVLSVGATSSRPLGGHLMGATEVWVGGEPPLVVSGSGPVEPRYGLRSALPDVAIPIAVVTPAYLRTVGTPLLRGRDFSRADDANALPVAIVNEAFTRRFRQGQVVVGRTVRYIDQEATIVGIVADVADRSLREPPEPTIFRPYSQTIVGPLGFLGISLMVRTDNEHSPGLFDLIRREIRAIDRAHPIDGLMSMVEVVDASLAAERQTALLLTLFGGLALVLAMIGTYGVSSYGVAQRTHEIGIRLALGAGRAGIWRLVAGPVFVATVAGIGLGLLSALGLTRFLETLLFGVSAMDVATFVTTALVIATASIGAVYLPARRAARVDPMMALRAD